MIIAKALLDYYQHLLCPTSAKWPHRMLSNLGPHEKLNEETLSHCTSQQISTDAKKLRRRSCQVHHPTANPKFKCQIPALPTTTMWMEHQLHLGSDVGVYIGKDQADVHRLRFDS